MLAKTAAVAVLAILVVIARMHEPHQAEAATSVLVTSPADSGEGSLRAAIERANTDPAISLVELRLSATIRLESGIVYSGPQALTISDPAEGIPAAITSGSSAQCTDALLVSTGGADLTVMDLELRDSTCGGIQIDVPAREAGTLNVTLRNMRLRNLGGDGLYIDDAAGSAAGVAVTVVSSRFERAGMAGDSSGIQILEAGDGGVAASITHTKISESGDYGLRIDEYGSGGVDLRTSSATFKRHGGDDLDNDGGISVLETGPGNATAALTDTLLQDNAGDGLEFFEEDAGDLALLASGVQSVNNGLGVTANIEGFEIDESEEGSLTATLIDVTIAGNYFGLECYEGGISDTDPGDLRVRLIRVSLLDNRSYGLYVDELRGGDLDVRASRLQVDRNGEHDENGAYALEGGTGDLLLELHDASFSQNAVDGAFIQEGDAGNLDASFVTSTVDSNGADGIETEQLASGTGLLSLSETAVSNNGGKDLRLLGVALQ